MICPTRSYRYFYVESMEYDTKEKKDLPLSRCHKMYFIQQNDNIMIKEAISIKSWNKKK